MTGALPHVPDFHHFSMAFRSYVHIPGRRRKHQTLSRVAEDCVTSLIASPLLNCQPMLLATTIEAAGSRSLVNTFRFFMRTDRIMNHANVRRSFLRHCARANWHRVPHAPTASARRIEGAKNRRKTSTSISPLVFVFRTAVSLNRAQRGPRRRSVSRRDRRESRRSEGTEQDQYGDSESARPSSTSTRS